jgi:hypothetical protein
MTGAQAAAVLGISRAAYSMRASRARRRLAAAVSSADHDDLPRPRGAAAATATAGDTSAGPAPRTTADDRHHPPGEDRTRDIDDPDHDRRHLVSPTNHTDRKTDR